MRHKHFNIENVHTFVKIRNINTEGIKLGN